MKIDRLLGIAVYLMNRGVVSTRALAERFEVSQRTIQRDVDVMGAAGIPITSTKGARGGYGIMEGFRMDRQIVSADDYMYLIAALKGLCSGYGGKQPDTTLEKLLSLAPDGVAGRQRLRLDFSVLRENTGINGRIAVIDAAIEGGRAVAFDYTNAEGHKSHPVVEPLAISYQWYSWYMFGYNFEKQDYRLYRLSRISDPTPCDKPAHVTHRNVDELMTEQAQRDSRAYIDLEMRCSASLRPAVEESFPGCAISEQDGVLLIRHRVPESERMWLGSLMSFGGEVTLSGPESAKEKLLGKAREILQKY